MSGRAPNKVEITISSSYVTPQYPHLPPTTKTIQMPSHHEDQPTPPQQASHPVSSESRASAQTTYRQRSSDILNHSSIAARAYDKPPQNSEEPKKKKKEGEKKLETARHVQNNIKSKLAHRKPRFQPQARHQQPPQTLKYSPPRPSSPNPTNHHLCISKPPVKSTPENKRQQQKNNNQQSISLHHAARQPQPLLVPQVQRQHLQRQQNLLFLRRHLPQLGCSDGLLETTRE
ncbi:hypothetical protein E5D57_004460 [Metarhizium anisopliae]|nr:hypothetical protein E5D57_004460 [Metarhizium anisopliae]